MHNNEQRWALAHFSRYRADSENPKWKRKTAKRRCAIFSYDECEQRKRRTARIRAILR